MRIIADRLGLSRVGDDLTVEQGDEAARLVALSILELFGPDIGARARSAVGMASLPFRIPVEIEAEAVVR